jgi:hypothetical protein
VGVDVLFSATPAVSFSTAALATELDTFSCLPENNKIQADPFHLCKNVIMMSSFQEQNKNSQTVHRYKAAQHINEC